jgi:hypothetical protein
MAIIRPYQTSDGATRYAVRYRKPDHKMTWKRGYTTNREAKEFAEQVEVDKRRGEYVAPKLGRVTVAELAPNWLARKKRLAPSYYRTLETAWRVHVQPRWCMVAVADVAC